MKAKKLFIAITAMVLFAVQGYAQREIRENASRNSTRSETRSVSRSSRREKSTSYQRQTRSKDINSFARVTNQSQRNVDRTRVSSSEQRTRERSVVSKEPTRVRQSPQSRGRSYVRPYSPNLPHHYGSYRPIYRHHNNYYHHHHRCIFDSWSWYSWGGYRNRFIRHSYYHNRFFDSLLGYYLWGGLESPTRIDLGASLSITRYNGRLKIFTGRNTTYLDLYRYQRVVYKVGYTTVEITTSYGYATIFFYDDYGNQATYRL